MSKSLSLIAAGAPASLLQTAAALVSKATAGGVKTAVAASAATAAVVVGPHPPVGVYAAVVRPPRRPAASAYDGVRAVVVRAVLPRAALGRLQLRDAVDVYHAAGIDSAAEAEAASAAFARAGALAARLATESAAKRVTLVVKPASKYERLNELFTRAAAQAVEAAGCTCDTLPTSRAANELLLFPERLGVVLTNDDPASANVQLAYASALGGVPATYHTEQGGTLSGGHSHRTVALALAQELAAMGLTAEAARIEAAAEKDPLNIENAM